jgi:hypothetical protein
MCNNSYCKATLERYKDSDIEPGICNNSYCKAKKERFKDKDIEPGMCIISYCKASSERYKDSDIEPGIAIFPVARPHRNFVKTVISNRDVQHFLLQGHIRTL